MPTAIEPEKILHDLHELWQQLGHDQEAAGGVLRACAMTLLVVAEGEEDSEKVRQTMGVLMHDHPCRAIVLRIKEGAELDARVFAECWKPHGGNQQICAEGVEVTSGFAQLYGVARVLVPLIVPDLPVVLWCRGNHALTPGLFSPVFSLAEKLVFDSSAALDGDAAIAALRDLRKRGHRLADLAWARLTGWREVLAQAYAENKPAVSSVKVTYGGTAPATTVRYFASWIQQALPSAKVSLESVPGDPGLRGVTLLGGTEIAITLADATSVEIRAGDRTSRFMLPAAGDDALMREELAIIGVDPVFDRVLA